MNHVHEHVLCPSILVAVKVEVMLKAADQAVVVVGDESIRSKSMDQELRYAVPTATSISTGTLEAKQVLLPETVSPRDIPHLDKMRLTDLSLRAPQEWQIDFQYATAKLSKVE